MVKMSNGKDNILLSMLTLEERLLIVVYCNKRGQVIVGNLVYTVGQLEYQTVESVHGEFWIVGVAVGGGVLLTVIFIILVIYKRKRTRAERQFKKLQLQLDTLESNIRNECKQGYRR